MRKRIGVIFLSLSLAVTPTMIAFAADETEVGEIMPETIEETVVETKAETITETSEETSLQEEVGLTTVETTEETMMETESETISETETESKGFTEKLIEEYSEEGILEEATDEFYACYDGILDFTDPNSEIIPLIIPCTYDYSMAHEVLRLVNQARAEYGIEPLIWDSELEEAACVRAAECSIVFDHTRPNGQNCFSLTDKMYGENIAAGYRSAESVVAGWMNSAGHRANILNPSFKSMGVSGVYSDGGIYWSQNFGMTNGDGRYIADGQEDVALVIEARGTEAACQVKNFVIRLYEKVLGRKADTVGLAEWFNQLILGNNTGAEVAQGFFFSDEFKNKNTSNETYVDVLYATMFDRSADPGGKSAWLDILDTGFSRTYAYRGFVESQEFTKLCESYGIQRGSVTLTEPRDQNDGITRFVSRLYSKALGRTPDVSGLNAWTNVILNKESSPEKVAFGFFFSDEMKKKNLSNEEFTKVLYRVFLNREADSAGLESWVKLLKDGMRRQAVMYGVSKSQEFGDVLRSFGLAPTQGTIVYVTSSGEKYHKNSCRTVRGNTLPLIIEDAESSGYTPCGVCYQ